MAQSSNQSNQFNKAIFVGYVHKNGWFMTGNEWINWWVMLQRWMRPVDPHLQSRPVLGEPQDDPVDGANITESSFNWKTLAGQGTDIWWYMMIYDL